MNNSIDVNQLISLSNEREALLREKEQALNEQVEEFTAQKEELTAAIEELLSKNAFLSSTLSELKQRNNELDQILYRASHDLKTPVASFRGLTSLLHSSGLNAEQDIIVHHLKDKTDQMDSVLTSLSELSTAFFKEVTSERFSVRELLLDTWARLNPAPCFRLQIELNPASFSTDRSLLTILVSNILKNAINFANTSPTVLVRGFVSDSSLTLEICDDGEEIPHELEGKIFEMFYRGSVKSTGPGLGLYTARRIVERLNGEIQLINTTPLKKFAITLPAIVG